jgi:predicted metalloprotease with PDZ domain
MSVRAPEGWQDALVPLDRDDDGVFSAPDYDALVDAPILVGERVERRFAFAGKDHRIALYGKHRGTDYDGMAHILRDIAEAAAEYMGGVPYPRYFLYLDVGGRGGGLEHANSARIAVAPDANSTFLATFAAHEFFHLWNVKRIRPDCLGPFDYARAPETPNLWFCEGVTEYVAGQVTLRAGLHSEADRLASLSRGIAAWSRTSWRRRVTADTASRKIWSGDWGSSYGGVSIYLSGEMIGLCLDLKLLQATGGRAGLREVLRDLMARHAQPKAGYGDDGIRDAAIRAGGSEMGRFYDRLCRTTADFPFVECLGYAGLTIGAGGDISVLREDTSSTRTLRRAWLYGK